MTPLPKSRHSSPSWKLISAFLKFANSIHDRADAEVVSRIRDALLCGLALGRLSDLSPLLLRHAEIFDLIDRSWSRFLRLRFFLHTSIIRVWDGYKSTSKFH